MSHWIDEEWEAGMDADYWGPDKLVIKGIHLVRTCTACPEQWDAYLAEQDGELCGYFRLRHGHFTVSYPECMMDEVFEGEPEGDGIFGEEERTKWLTKGVQAIRARMEEEMEELRIKEGNLLRVELVHSGRRELCTEHGYIWQVLAIKDGAACVQGKSIATGKEYRFVPRGLEIING